MEERIVPIPRSCKPLMSRRWIVVLYLIGVAVIGILIPLKGEHDVNIAQYFTPMTVIAVIATINLIVVVWRYVLRRGQSPIKVKLVLIGVNLIGAYVGLRPDMEILVTLGFIVVAAVLWFNIDHQLHATVPLSNTEETT